MKINGWSFNFKDMAAYRTFGDWRPEYGPWTLFLTEIEGAIHQWNGIGTAHKPIFDEPEDGFNEQVYRAFVDWKFEKEFLSPPLDGPDFPKVGN